MEKVVLLVSWPFHYFPYGGLTHLQIQAEINFYHQFQDGWPIRDILAWYLSNKSSRNKQDIEAERKDAKADSRKRRRDASGNSSDEEEGEDEEDEEDEEDSYDTDHEVKSLTHISKLLPPDNYFS